jgi:hypothetical protein
MSSRILPGLAATLAVATAVRWYSGAAAGDDTFIYMRYVQNALEGAGFAFNPGEPSYGVTSLLWTLLMAPVAALAGNTVRVWQAISALLLGAAAGTLIGGLRARGLGLAGAGGLAAVLCLEPHTFRWSGSGMENGLAVLALTLLALAALRHAEAPGRGRAAALGVAAGLAPFVRPELGLFAAGLVALAVARHGRGTRLVLAGTAAAVLAVGAGVAWVALGSPLPQTALAKALQLRQTDGLYAVRATLTILVTGSAGSLAILLRRPAWSPTGEVAAVLLIGSGLVTAYLVAQNALVSTRYASSLSLPVVLGAVLVVADQARRGRLAGWVVAGLVLQVLGSIAVLVYLAPATRARETEQIREFAEAVRRHTPADARIALTEVGALGFYSRRYVIDLVGLTDTATLAWCRRHGRPETPDQVQALLTHRGATHFVQTFGEPSEVEGLRVQRPAMVEQPVERNNFSKGTIRPDQWRLYALRGQTSKP